MVATAVIERRRNRRETEAGESNEIAAGPALLVRERGVERVGCDSERTRLPGATVVGRVHGLEELELPALVVAAPPLHWMTSAPSSVAASGTGRAASEPETSFGPEERILVSQNGVLRDSSRPDNRTTDQGGSRTLGRSVSVASPRRQRSTAPDEWEPTGPLEVHGAANSYNRMSVIQVSVPFLIIEPDRNSFPVPGVSYSAIPYIHPLVRYHRISFT